MNSSATPIMFDSHMHTPLCKHAVGHPSEYVEVAIERGLAGIIFTCHSPMPDGFSHRIRMVIDQFEEYCNLIEETAQSAPDGFEVRLGMESDFFPGMEPWLEQLHQQADFHYILGSVHWHTEEYRSAYWKGNLKAFQKHYFNHLAESAETGLFDCLAHPDLVKNIQPESWQFNKAKKYIAKALDRIAVTGVTMELNTSGINKPYSEMNPGVEMLAMMQERNIPVVLGSDSHRPDRVADGFLNALNHLETAGFEMVSVFENRQRCELPINQVRDSLTKV